MNIVGAPSASEVDVNVEPDVYKCSWYNRIIKRPVDWGGSSLGLSGATNHFLVTDHREPYIDACSLHSYMIYRLRRHFNFYLTELKTNWWTQLDHVFIFLSICDWFNSMFDFLRLIHFKLSFFFYRIGFYLLQPEADIHFIFSYHCFT